MRPIPSAVAAKTAPATTHPTYTSEVDEDFKKLPAPEKGDRTDAGLSEHEDDAIHQSPVELQKRIRQLERDASASNIKTKQSRSGGLFKTICSTDLLFLIDCTASMSGHIHAAKTQVIRIVDAVSEAFFGDAEIRISVVGYRDHKDRPNIQFLDFVHSAERVRTFLAGLKATGGGDLPEDVLGGIRQALGASWKHPTRTVRITSHVQQNTDTLFVYARSSTLPMRHPTALSFTLLQPSTMIIQFQVLSRIVLLSAP